MRGGMKATRWEGGWVTALHGSHTHWSCKAQRCGAGDRWEAHLSPRFICPSLFSLEAGKPPSAPLWDAQTLAQMGICHCPANLSRNNVQNAPLMAWDAGICPAKPGSHFLTASVLISPKDSGKQWKKWRLFSSRNLDFVAVVTQFTREVSSHGAM